MAGSDSAARAAAGVALLGAVGPVTAGLVGGDVAVPFAISGGLLVGTAVAGGLQRPSGVGR